jgi:hypothetical protein
MTTSSTKGSSSETLAATAAGEQSFPVLCGRCDWRFSFPGATVRSALPRCPHCYHAELTLLSGEDTAVPETVPELVLPFELPENTLRKRLQAFAEGIRFAPTDLSPANLTARLERVYLPMWLVDTDVGARWEAEMGFDYDVVSHQAHYGDQRGWDTREVTETRIRWEPRLGTLKRSYQNVSAPALEEHTQLQASLGPYDLGKAAPYQQGSLADAAARLPNRDHEDAWPEAVLRVQAAATEECRQAAQAEHIRGFRWSPDYHNHNWTQLLLPLYTTFYLDDEQAPRPILINGQTGRLHGQRRASMARAQRTSGILLVIAAVLFILGLASGGFSVLLPALLLPAGIGLFLGLLIGIGAGIPVLIVWQFNRAQTRMEPQ